MDGDSFALRAADDGALAYVERLLRNNGLPTDDVRERPECFFVGHAGGRRVGVGGVETYGTEGLLRSVAVEESVRGRGYGSALCDALEARAERAGVRTLYVLTTTAEAFFERRGYVAVERDDAPAAVRETTQFAELCPASATCMRTSL